MPRARSALKRCPKSVRSAPSRSDWGDITALRRPAFAHAPASAAPISCTVSLTQPSPIRARRLRSRRRGPGYRAARTTRAARSRMLTGRPTCPLLGRLIKGLSSTPRGSGKQQSGRRHRSTTRREAAGVAGASA
eukprot:gene11336-biopygen7260